MMIGQICRRGYMRLLVRGETCCGGNMVDTGEDLDVQRLGETEASLFLGFFVRISIRHSDCPPSCISLCPSVLEPP